MDRSISWLHFVIANHRREAHPELFDAVSAFLESGGEDFSQLLHPHLHNPAVTHFARILGSDDAADDEKVERAARAVDLYDCVGIYEQLDQFLSDLAAMIGIPAPASLQPVNVTETRPRAAHEITPKLRDRLRALTGLGGSLRARRAAGGQALTDRAFAPAVAVAMGALLNRPRRASSPD